MVISDIPRHKMESINDISKTVESKVYLEAGSAVEVDTLNLYKRFAMLPLDTDQNEKFLEISKGVLGLEVELELPSLLNNTCGELYCLQDKIAFENLPSAFWKALIGIEDRRYLDHKGVDFRSLFRALIHDISKMRFEQGGSTLTQQLVKNIYFTNEKTLWRKVKEFIIAVYVEIKYKKEQILQAYFNEVFWGTIEGVNIKGVSIASKLYFDKPVSKVTPYEASILISLLKGPNYYNPLRRLERLKQRTKTVVRKLIEQGFYSEISIKRWSEEDWESWIEDLRNRNDKKGAKSIWKSFSIKDTGLDDFEKLVLIKSVNKIKKFAHERTGQDVGVKLVFGKISDEKPFRYYSQVERSFEKAMREEKHQIGSTIKPIVYGVLQRKNNLNLQEEVETAPIELKIKSGVWKPRDSHKVKEKKVKLVDALRDSLNIPLVRTVSSIGFESIEKDLKKLFSGLKTPLKEYPAQVLGAVELSVDEYFEVYKNFLKEYCDDNPMSVINILSDPARTTIRNRVNKYMKNMTFFGKTGTTNNGLDNWFVFFDGQKLAIIWVGIEDRKQIKSATTLYGSNTAFRIVQDLVYLSGKSFHEFGCPKKDTDASEID